MVSAVEGIHCMYLVQSKILPSSFLLAFLFSSLSHPLPSLSSHFSLLLQILWKVDTILFCLLVLRGLSDSQGRIWRVHPTQFYAIEVTLPEHLEQVCYSNKKLNH